MLQLPLSPLCSLPKPDAVIPRPLKAEGFLFAQMYHWVAPLGAPLLHWSPEPLGTEVAGAVGVESSPGDGDFRCRALQNQLLFWE